MYIAYLKDGSTFTEQDGTWDDLPNIPITSLHLTLPVRLITINQQTGEQIEKPSPTVHLSNYDAYYFANEAISVIFRTFSGVTRVEDGKGELVKQVIAGIDYAHDLVVYIEVDKQANVTVKRFPVRRFTEGEQKVQSFAIKKGFVSS